MHWRAVSVSAPPLGLQPDHNGRIFTLRNQKMLP
jgi:hypothetical protein